MSVTLYNFNLCPNFQIQNNIEAFQLLAVTYVKYIQIFRKLEECYDQVNLYCNLCFIYTYKRFSKIQHLHSSQIVHPQKRRVVRHVLDGTIGRYAIAIWFLPGECLAGSFVELKCFFSMSHFRILELKNDMVLLEHSEYHYFDDVLSDLKLTPVCQYFLCNFKPHSVSYQY